MKTALILLSLATILLSWILLKSTPDPALPTGRLILSPSFKASFSLSDDKTSARIKESRTGFGKTVPQSGIVFPIGAYQLDITVGQKPQIRISKNDHILMQNRQGESLVHVSANRLSYRHNRGMFQVKERFYPPCKDMHLLSFSRTGDIKSRGITLAGYVDCPDGPLEYQIKFLGDQTNALVFDIQLGEDAEERGYSGITLVAEKNREEAFFGFGAQMSRLNFSGARFPLLVSEQGIGRGVEPISTLLELFYGGANGRWHSAYAPVPATITNHQRGLFFLSHATAFIDLRAENRMAYTFYTPRILGALTGGPPLDMLGDITKTTGRQKALPSWVGEGAILGLQGGTKNVAAKLDILKQAGVPVAALWLQDWSGQRSTIFGKQVWWSWTLDETRYPDWTQFRDALKKEDIDLLTYINPFLVDITPWSAKTQLPRRNLFFEAFQFGYLIKKKDGSPYLIRNTSFDAGLLDLSKPAVQDWIVDVIKTEVASQGVRGWMADFGEGMPVDITLASGDQPDLYHNAYPDIWAHINRRALEELGMDKDAFVFHRSGHFGAAGRAPAFWLGDQLVTWDAMDGFKSAIIGHLSSGLSGHGITHADIGGYTTVTTPLKNYHRSKELLMRWAEFAAFTPIFRTHEGNQPDHNHQIYSDLETAQHFGRMARIYKCFNPYRQKLGRELDDHGWPYVRHPFLHYPLDPVMLAMTYQQIMLGQDVMMAPVTDPGGKEVDLYLPDGDWIHFWTGAILDAGHHKLKAPLGQPVAVIRKSSPDAIALLQCRDYAKNAND